MIWRRAATPILELWQRQGGDQNMQVPHAAAEVRALCTNHAAIHGARIPTQHLPTVERQAFSFETENPNRPILSYTVATWVLKPYDIFRSEALLSGVLHGPELATKGVQESELSLDSCLSERLRKLSVVILIRGRSSGNCNSTRLVPPRATGGP